MWNIKVVILVYILGIHIDMCLCASNPTKRLTRDRKKRESPDTVTNAAPTTASCGGAFAQNQLKKTNEYRRKHGAADLTLDCQLTLKAENWAKELAKTDKWEHSSKAKRPNEGENLFAGWGSAGAPSGDAATDDWYSEVDNYDYTTGTTKSGCIPTKENNDCKIGHFTQVVWKGTTRMGIGKATSSGNWVYVVGRYVPTGNDGQFVLNVERPQDDGFIKLGNTDCTWGYGDFTSIGEAQASCLEDSNCQGVLNEDCKVKYGRFELCRMSSIYTLDSEDCIHQKSKACEDGECEAGWTCSDKRCIKEECSDGLFRCQSDGTCVSGCNGEVDCADGSDEASCVCQNGDDCPQHHGNHCKHGICKRDCSRGTYDDIRLCCLPKSPCKATNGHCEDPLDCASGQCGDHSDCNASITDSDVNCCK